MPVARSGKTGRKSDIGTAPSQLVSESGNIVLNEGVQVVTSSSNSDTVWVGYTSDITANSADLTDGFPLSPGAAMFFPCRHLRDIWVRSTSGSSQTLWFLGQ